MKTLILFAIGIFPACVAGQVIEVDSVLKAQRADSLDGWRAGGQFSLTGTNVGLVNWAAGGQNSLSVNSGFRLYANLKKDSVTWDNSVDVNYGLMRQGQSGWLKTDDRIDFNSKFSSRASKIWYYAALLNFKTQMTEGYNYPNDSVKISTFFSPAYVLGAFGMDCKPSSNFSMFMAPLTSKLTFVGNQDLANAGAFGVDKAILDSSGAMIEPGKRFRAELGGYIRSQFKVNFAQNLSFTSRLDLFTNYLHNPQNIDVNWEALLDVKLWKFLTVTFLTQLIYDDDVDITIYDSSGNITGVGPRVQFRHMTGLGLTWKFDRVPKNIDEN
jgi:hypothetical protein